MTNLDAFTRAYIEAALWSSTAYGSPDENEADPANANGDRHGTFDASFQACNYDAGDLSPELLAHVIEDCAAFQRDQADLLARAYASEVWICGERYNAACAGHDFWLTRNGHGAGFWDRGLPDAVGTALTDAAHAYGSEDWYVDDPEQDYSGVIRGW